MLSFPIRLVGTLFLALFCYSRWVRRAVVAVLVSTVFVAAQNPWLMDGSSSPSGQPSIVQAVSLLAGQ